MKVIKKDCQLEDAEDRSLPYTCFIVSYRDDGIVKHDLVYGSKQSEIFDYYWDLYKKDFVTMKQSEGRVNPKLWNDPSQKKAKKK